MTERTTLILATALAVAAGAGVYFLTKDRAPAPAQTVGSTTPQTATSTGTSATTATVGAGSSAERPTLMTPDYTKPIAFSAEVAPDIRAQLTASAAKAQEAIKKDPLDFRSWVNLGTYHKMGGDYAVAAEYWTFVAGAFVGPSAPNYALGDLYQNFIKDYAKAEEYYLLAIQYNPRHVDAYASLYRLYRYQVGDQTKATAILAQGLKANPGNNYLESLDD